jgi:hypothetical protein
MEEDHGWLRLRRPPDDALLDLLEVDDLIKSDVDPSDASCLCLFVRPPTQEDTTDLRRFRYLMDVYQLLSHRPIYLEADCDDASSFHYKCRNEETCQFHVKIKLPTCRHRDQWRLYSDVPSGRIQVEQAYHSTWCTMVEQVEAAELLHHDMVLTEELSSAILVASWRREKSASSSAEVGPAELCLNVSHDRLQHARIIFSRWTCCVRDRSFFQLWQMTTRRGDYSFVAVTARLLLYTAKLRVRPEDGCIKALGKFLTACILVSIPVVFGLCLYFVYAAVLPAIFVMGPYTLSRAVWGRSREMALVAEYQANGATVLGHISHRWESHGVHEETGEPVSTYGCELTYYTPNGIAVTRFDKKRLSRPPRGAGGPGVNFTVLPYNPTSGMPSYMLEQFNANISRYGCTRRFWLGLAGLALTMFFPVVLVWLNFGRFFGFSSVPLVFGSSSVLLVQMGVLVAVEISARRQLSALYSGRNVVPFSGLFTTWWVHRIDACDLSDGPIFIPE